MKQLALRNNTPPSLPVKCCRRMHPSSSSRLCTSPVRSRVSARDVSTYWSLSANQFVSLSLCLCVTILSVCDVSPPVPCYSVMRLSKCLW